MNDSCSEEEEFQPIVVFECRGCEPSSLDISVRAGNRSIPALRTVSGPGIVSGVRSVVGLQEGWVVKGPSEEWDNVDLADDWVEVDGASWSAPSSVDSSIPPRCHTNLSPVVWQVTRMSR